MARLQRLLSSLTIIISTDFNRPLGPNLVPNLVPMVDSFVCSFNKIQCSVFELIHLSIVNVTVPFEYFLNMRNASK